MDLNFVMVAASVVVAFDFVVFAAFVVVEIAVVAAVELADLDYYQHLDFPYLVAKIDTVD